MSDELVPKHYQYTNPHLDRQADKETEIIKEGRGEGEVETGDWA